MTPLEPPEIRPLCRKPLSQALREQVVPLFSARSPPGLHPRYDFMIAIFPPFFPFLCSFPATTQSLSLFFKDDPFRLIPPRIKTFTEEPPRAWPNDGSTLVFLSSPPLHPSLSKSSLNRAIWNSPRLSSFLSASRERQTFLTPDSDPLRKAPAER